MHFMCRTIGSVLGPVDLLPMNLHTGISMHFGKFSHIHSGSTCELIIIINKYMYDE